MELNTLVFPTTKPTYTARTFVSNLIYVPRHEAARPTTLKPALRLPPDQTTLLDKSLSAVSPSAANPLEEQLDASTLQSDNYRSLYLSELSASAFSSSLSGRAVAPPAGIVPCLYLPYRKGSSKVLLYFHGNAEDVGTAYDFLRTLQRSVHVHVLAVEYPGYGIYRGTASEERVLADAESVFQFLTEDLEWPVEDVIIAGRSIGSGPACHLASRHRPCALLLISAFTSVRGAVKDMFGRLSQFLVKERFDNLEKMPDVRCPAFLLHGTLDRVVPCEHSR